MKKVFCFSLIVMILALASSPLLVKADDVSVVTPFVDSPTLTNEQIYDLENATLFLEYLRNGGTIDVANTSSDYDADDLLSDFGNYVRDLVGEFFDFVNPFQTDIEYHGLQPITPAKSAIIQFMGVLPFYALSETPEEPQSTPPADYTYYIDLINGSGFDFIRNLSNIQFTQTPPIQNYFWYNSLPWSNRSFYKINRFDSTTNWNFDSINFNNPIFAVNQIDNIYITSYNGGYQVTLNPFFNYDLPLCYSGSYDSNLNIPIYKNCIYGTYDGTYGQVFLGNGNYSGYNWGSPVTRTDSNLTDLFDWLSQKVRNVNIYVDGDLWSTGNQNINYTINISTSTTVPIKDGTGKVEWLYDYEIYFDIDRIQDDLNTLLNYIRNNPQSPTIIKYDDLDDVIVDVNGQPAVAIKVLADTRNIDQIYIDNYGPIIPAFLPLFTPVIDDVDIITIADTAVSPIPDDLLEVFGYMFMGVLFVGFIHRLLE